MKNRRVYNKLVRDNIPLFEFDSDREAVLSPGHEHLNLQLPKKAVFPFLGESVYRFAERCGAVIAGKYESVSKDFPVYVTKYRGEEICICEAPVGAAQATAILDWLISYGVREIISAGSCGVLCDIPEGTFLLPVKALRDEGTSYHYAPPSRYIDLDCRGIEAVRRSFLEHRINYREVTTWTTDGLYRETAAKVQSRRDEGCSTVEMECAALAACAAFRGASFGMILFSADSLADTGAYDERSWGELSRDYAMMLALDAVIKYKGE